MLFEHFTHLLSLPVDSAMDYLGFRYSRGESKWGAIWPPISVRFDESDLAADSLKDEACHGVGVTVRVWTTVFCVSTLVALNLPWDTD